MWGHSNDRQIRTSEEPGVRYVLEVGAGKAEALRRINLQVTSDFFTVGFQDSVLRKELTDIFRQVGISPEME